MLKAPFRGYTQHQTVLKKQTVDPAAANSDTPIDPAVTVYPMHVDCVQEWWNKKSFFLVDTGLTRGTLETFSRLSKYEKAFNLNLWVFHDQGSKIKRHNNDCKFCQKQKFYVILGNETRLGLESAKPNLNVPWKEVQIILKLLPFSRKGWVSNGEGIALLWYSWNTHLLCGFWAVGALASR